MLKLGFDFKSVRLPLKTHAFLRTSLPPTGDPCCLLPSPDVTPWISASARLHLRLTRPLQGDLYFCAPPPHQGSQPPRLSAFFPFSYLFSKFHGQHHAGYERTSELSFYKCLCTGSAKASGEFSRLVAAIGTS